MQDAYAHTANFCTMQYYRSQSAFKIYVGNHVHIAINFIMQNYSFGAVYDTFDHTEFGSLPQVFVCCK